MSQSNYNPARRLAVGVLRKVLGEGAYAAPTLDSALARAELPYRDAGLATHVVYGTLRYISAVQTAVDPLLKDAKTPIKLRALLYAGAFEKLFLGTPDHAVVSEYVNLAKVDLGKMSGVVNAVLRRATQTQEPTLPEWLQQSLAVVYGDQAETIQADFLEPSPLWLWLSDEGIRILENAGALLETGYGDIFKVVLGMPLRASQAYRRGQVQPINPASFAVVQALGDVRGQTVLDLAGGSGIKAAFLALQGAEVLSVDIDARKHRLAEENLKRLGVSARYHMADLRYPLKLPAQALVLFDAPCSGTGTLRAHPEIQLRITPEYVQEMVELQSQMLDTVAHQVSAGGVLVYSVCSLTPEEGVLQIQNFLSKHPEFSAEDFTPSVPSCAAAVGYYTLPLDGVDGFYIARLRRRVV